MYNLSETIKKKNKYYEQFPRDGECQFCKLPESERIEQTDSFIVLRNIFGYDIFDMCEVSDHLMVIPKKHVDKLSDLTDAEQHELIGIMVRYEDKGYNVYFREPTSEIKTVTHHHTHLIKLGKRLQTIKYTKDPYSLEYS